MLKLSSLNSYQLLQVLFPRHFSPQTREETISRIQLFRDYLHYHIKCSKAYMHSRMRHRASEFLKILNRARPEPVGEKERKTITYVPTPVKPQNRSHSPCTQWKNILATLNITFAPYTIFLTHNAWLGWGMIRSCEKGDFVHSKGSRNCSLPEKEY